MYHIGENTCCTAFLNMQAAAHDSVDRILRLDLQTDNPCFLTCASNQLSSSTCEHIDNRRALVMGDIFVFDSDVMFDASVLKIRFVQLT